MCPRAGVPYPERVLCSLKNTIAMIEQKLGLKIEKINGVGPDPSGNVTIASGDSALTVEEDASQHLVTIGLDRTELPTAAVTSVNGETGAVQLNASEIPGKGVNKTVMDNINTLENVGLQMRSDLNDEITARGNADAVLQTNINNVTASLPGAAAAAVAADPTIASLVAADSQNVKLSGDQSIGGIKTVSTEATGTYSSQIANSNKVKNELDNYPQMVRTGNAQNINGEKTFNSPILGQIKPYKTFGSNTTAGWYAIGKIPKSQQIQAEFTVQTPGNYNKILTNTSISNHVINVIKYVGNYTPNRNAFLLAEVSDGYVLYVWSPTYRTNILKVEYYGIYGTCINYNATTNFDSSVFTGTPEPTKPAVGGDIIAVYDEVYLQETQS